MNVFESITQGLNEAIDYEKGKGKARKAKVSINPAPDFSPQEIKSVRNSLEMTQATFAAVLGVSVKTVEAWEAGTNKPLKTACRMLSMLKADPTILVKYDIVTK